MGLLNALFGWRPKEGAVYSPHDSVHRRSVGQKVYVTTGIVSRSVKIIISGQVYTGVFSVSKGVCKIRITSDKEHRFLTPEENVKFHKDVTTTNENGQNQYGMRFSYPKTSIVYTAEVIDAQKMKDISEEFSGRSNFEIMERLFKDGVIKSQEPDFINHNPPRTKAVSFSRIEGLLLGIAIGDSLGNTSESKTPARRNKEYGLITSYLPNKHANYKRIGLPSDDTQLAFDTLEVILEKGYLDMESLARVFSSHRIFGIGKTVKGFLRNYKKYGEPWYSSGIINGNGNGALMRIAPVVISYLKSPKENLWADTILDTMMTHNGALAIGSSVAFVNLLYEFLHCKSAPRGGKWLDDFIRVLAAFTGNTEYKIRNAEIETDFSHIAPDFIKQAIDFGFEKGMSIKEFSDYFGSGAYVLETDAMFLYIISKYLDDPQEAILQAVNYTKDNDTIASITGAAMGALYGKKAFKREWIEGLSGRIRENDDGKIFEMIEKTKRFLSTKR